MGAGPQVFGIVVVFCLIYDGFGLVDLNVVMNFGQVLVYGDDNGDELTRR